MIGAFGVPVCNIRQHAKVLQLFASAVQSMHQQLQDVATRGESAMKAQALAALPPFARRRHSDLLRVLSDCTVKLRTLSAKEALFAAGSPLDEVQFAPCLQHDTASSGSMISSRQPPPVLM